MKFLRSTIASQNNRSLKDVFDVLHDQLSLLGEPDKYMQWYLMVTGAI